MGEVIKRFNINDLCELRNKMISQYKEIQEMQKTIDETFSLIGAYPDIKLDNRIRIGGSNQEQKDVDQKMWVYLISYCNLEKYMLCTDYKNLEKEIEQFKTPDFTFENVTNWIAGLKSLIYDNVNTLIKSIFKSITEGSYYTGGGSYNSSKKKKRNNNGVDNFFILSVNDWSTISGYNMFRPTITDDLEKVCYIISGYPVPDITCKDIMRKEHKFEYENEFFKLKIHQNGNTHYTITDAVKNKLNLYGAGNNIFGEDIKIKIFEKH